VNLLICASRFLAIYDMRQEALDVILPLTAPDGLPANHVKALTRLPGSGFVYLEYLQWNK